MILDVIELAVAISERSPQAVLFIGPEYDAHGSARAHSECFHQTDGLPCRHATPAVVHRTLSHIPGVDMSAEHDDLLGKLATDELCDDVSRTGVGKLLCL